MVAQDQDALGLDRGGEVAIADMPGKPGNMYGIAAAHLEQFLVGSKNLGLASIVEHQHVAIFQDERLGKVDENAVAVHQGDHLAPDMALVMRQDGDVEGDLPVRGNVGGPQTSCCPQHGDDLIPGASMSRIASNRRRIHDAW